MTQMFGPESCPGYNGCAAPLCPLEPTTLAGGCWYPDEPTCTARAFTAAPWVRTQRRIAKALNRRGAEAGYFTVKMFAAVKAVTKGLRGIGPDGRQSELSWLSQRKVRNTSFAEKSNMPAPVSQGHLWGDDGSAK